MQSGPFRQVPEGTSGAEWAEGAGWIVFDEQAQRETRAAADLISRRYWEEERRRGRAIAAEAQRKLNVLDGKRPCGCGPHEGCEECVSQRYPNGDLHTPY